MLIFFSPFEGEKFVFDFEIWHEDYSTVILLPVFHFLELSSHFWYFVVKTPKNEKSR